MKYTCKGSRVTYFWHVSVYISLSPHTFNGFLTEIHRPVIQEKLESVCELALLGRITKYARKEEYRDRNTDIAVA